MNDTFQHRFLDSLATSVLSFLSISSFYGLWVLEDLILGDVGRETDDPVRGINGGISYVSYWYLKTFNVYTLAMPNYSLSFAI